MAALALARMMAVDVVTSDFDHAEKTKRDHRQSPDFNRIVYVRTRPYANNVGLARLLSHIDFSLRAAAYYFRNRRQYEIVYATAPLNLLAWIAFSAGRASTKIIDVVDIWPDVLPFSPGLRRRYALLFKMWKWLFKSSVRKADMVMDVSDEFLREARQYARATAELRRFYLGQEKLTSQVAKQPVFTLAYIGNIGSLYDFATLLDVLQENDMRSRMQLFIIGAGDRKDWLLGELVRRGIRHTYFGIVYDAVRLSEILAGCHVGFNGYANTSAAFSYKAVSYLAAGLPILNSMNGDLRHLVDEYGLGENYQSEDKLQLRDAILRICQNLGDAMARRCETFFNEQLQADRILHDMATFLACSVRPRAQSDTAKEVDALNEGR